LQRTWNFCAAFERIIEFPVESFGVMIVPLKSVCVEQRDVGAGEGDVSGANVELPVGALAGVGVLMGSVGHELFLDANPAPTPPPTPAAMMQNSKTTNAQNTPTLNPSILLVAPVPLPPSPDQT